MVSLRANAFALLAGLSLFIHVDDAVPQACATPEIAARDVSLTFVVGSNGCTINYVTS
jgi:hypothetical protein